MNNAGSMQAFRLGLPALLTILAYLAGINLLGAWIGRRQKDAKDYFLAGHAMPWWAVMGSVVATETSALTFLSIPGEAYRTGFAFLQLIFGYILGRIAIAFLLLPAYFKRELATAYALLETRFGAAARRATSLLFMATRVLAAAVRLAVPAIPIALMFGIPVWAAALILAGATTLYTLLGGIKAVIWIDLIQVAVYLTGAALALGFLLAAVPDGLHAGLAAGARQFFDFRFDFSQPYTFWSGILGGAFLSMASHGADQLIVQRLLACRGLREAQRALIGSGFLVLVQMTLFLSVGVLLVLFFHGRPIDPAMPGAFSNPDQVFPTFIVGHLPALVSAYLVAGLLSAAMCSESSALNSLSSALAHDLVGPLRGRQTLEGRRGLVLGRWLTLFWSLLLAGLAVGFSLLTQTQPAVQIALGLASVTAGGLLGAFLLALYVRRARQADLLCAVGGSVAFTMTLWLGAKGWIPFSLGRRVAWPWYSLIGSVITLVAGWLLSLRHRAADRAGSA